MIHDILGTHYGDVNLDGRFDSGDLVLIFQAGEYDDNLANNSTWADGDWNCDGEFDSQDLVRAFQDGGYRIDVNPNRPNG
ncbi:MAG: dockerin type I domain-containing protein [Pirellulaceae bacterium]